MDASKFFADNISRISPQSDPVAWNTQQGLYALAKQIEEMQQQQANQDRLLRNIATFLERSRPR